MNKKNKILLLLCFILISQFILFTDEIEYKKIRFEKDFSAEDFDVISVEGRVINNQYEFKIKYRSEKNRYYAFFDPPEGELLRILNKEGIEIGENEFIIMIPEGVIRNLNNISLRFSENKNRENDRNFIYLKLFDVFRL